MTVPHLRDEIHLAIRDPYHAVTVDVLGLPRGTLQEARLELACFIAAIHCVVRVARL